MQLTSVLPAPITLARRRGQLALTVRAHLIAMTARKQPVDGVTDDPRHVFLTASEVIARYRWGRTKGYEQLRDQGFPRPVAGRYRLDLLMAWEDGLLAEAAPPPTSTPVGPPAKRHFDRKRSA